MAAGLVVAVLLLGLVGAIRFAQSLPDGPVEIAWDRDSCGHCRMHVGDPAFAVQLQLKDGEVLNFDDPGCLLKYEVEKHPSIHAIYFHHVREDRWLTREEVAFVPTAPTPMGYGLGAVAAGTEGSLSYEAAQARVVGTGHGAGGH